MNDMRERKEIDFDLPGNIRKHIIVKNVETTVDGKYVLEYYYNDNGMIKEDYTEIIFTNGRWAKYPFRKDYNTYNFNIHDEETSKRIISELPRDMRVKISVFDDKERKPKVIPELIREMLLQETGAVVVKDKSVNKQVYMVLLANDGNHSIIAKNENSFYQFNYPFPVFSFSSDSLHSTDSNSSNNDENYGIEYNQKEFIRDDISTEARKSVSEFLENQENLIDITKLPILDVVNNKNEVISICFVSCPNLTMFDNIYKSSSLSIGCDSVSNCIYDNLLDSAFHNERPLIIKSNNEIKTNGVRYQQNKEKK